MGDINFFSRYTEKRNKYAQGIIFFGIILIVFLGTPSAISLKNHFGIRSMTTKIEDIDLIITNPKRMEAIKSYDETKRKTALISSYLLYVESLTEAIEKNDQINTVFYSKLEAIMPQSVYMQNLSITENNMTISGHAKSKKSIAEFEHNLEQLEMIEYVYIYNINKIGDEENFVANCTLKSGDSK